jgi:hypothetical protein
LKLTTGSDEVEFADADKTSRRQEMIEVAKNPEKFISNYEASLSNN